MYLLPDGRKLHRRDDFELDGKLHKANVFDDPDTLISLGVKRIVEVRGFDLNYYVDADYEDVGEEGVDKIAIITRVYSSKPRYSLDQLRVRVVEGLNRLLDSELLSTDRFVLRAIELSNPLSASIGQARADARMCYSKKIADATIAATYEELVAIAKGSLVNEYRAA